MIPTSTPTLVILSGGMDSTVLAYHIEATAKLVGCVSVNYGQRHAKELECAARTCARLGVPHHLINLSGLGKHLSNSALTCGLHTPDDIAVPHGHYAAENMKTTVVPNRNMILLALATGVAINQGAKAVAYGAHAGDHAIYPDCRSEFADAMGIAISLCDFEPLSFRRPFINSTKADIVRLGTELQVRFDETWTCYEGGAIACGKCGTCVERLEAFDLAGETDPLIYKDLHYWRSVLKEPVSPRLPLNK